MKGQTGREMRATKSAICQGNMLPGWKNLKKETSSIENTMSSMLILAFIFLSTKWS